MNLVSFRLRHLGGKTHAREQHFTRSATGRGQNVHAKQWSALWRAVTGLVQGGQLWLTALGRSLPGATTDKHQIKAADHLLGSPAIQRALPKLYAVLAALLLRRIRRPIILIDWTGGGTSAFYILCASLCFRGRALPLWSRTFPVKRKVTPKAEHEFLMESRSTSCLAIPVRIFGERRRVS